MQAIIFTGIQASGKSTFYLKNFFDTHVHISLDKLNTRHKEQRFLQTCFDTQTPFVADRKKYIDLAHQYKYKVVGYFFHADVGAAALERNALREGKKRIPNIGVKSTAKKLEIPDNTEGYDELYIVQLNEKGSFNIEKQ
jgi:predicted kinase